MRSKTFLILSAWTLWGISSLPATGAFPSEPEMQAHLRKGMTTQKVRSAFGEPGNQIGRRGEDCVFRYLPPFALLTAERAG